MILLMQPRICLAFWAVSAHWWLISNFSPTSAPKYSSGLLSIPSHPRLYWYQGLPQPGCRTLHLALLNLRRFTWAHLSSLSRSLWIASHPSGMSTTPLILVSSAKLLGVHLTPLSMMSLMKILNSTGPNTDTQETPLVTDLLFWTSSLWPLSCGCNHSNNSYSTQQSTHQIHFPPI